MVRPHSRGGEQTSTGKDPRARYGDIVEAATNAAAKSQVAIVPPSMQRVAEIVMIGVAQIPRFGHTFDTAVYPKLDMRIRGIKEHGMISETAESTLLEFFGYTSVHPLQREGYDTTLRVIYDHIEESVQKARNAKLAAVAEDEQPHRQTLGEIAFSAGQYAINMAARYELGSEMIPQRGAGFQALLGQLVPEACLTVRACIGYALPTTLYRQPKI